MADIKVELYPEKIAMLERAINDSLELTANAILGDIKTSQVVPKDTGTLEDSGFVDMQGKIARIVFDTPYARKLYFNPQFNFRTDKNPNAQGEWMNEYSEGGIKYNFVIESYIKFLKMRSGGLVK